MRYPIAEILFDLGRDYISEGTLVRIVDGDTWEADLDVGHHVEVKRIGIRPQGYDAPEISKAKHPLEKIHGELASEYLSLLLDRPVTHRVQTLHKLIGTPQVSITRWRAHAWLRDEERYGVQLMPLAMVMRLEGYQKLPLSDYRRLQSLQNSGGHLIAIHISSHKRRAEQLYKLLGNGSVDWSFALKCATLGFPSDFAKYVHGSGE